MFIQKITDTFADSVASWTRGFVKTKIGEVFLSLSLVGPLTFLPTLWSAWTAENIDALRTWTWPLMVVVNTSVFLALCHKGEWRVRLSILIWIVFMLATWLATVVR